MSRCAKCNREIVWAISPNGAGLPLREVSGKVYTLMGTFEREGEDVPRAIKLTFEPGTEQPIYVSHFFDCPAANEFSGRNRKAKGT